MTGSIARDLQELERQAAAEVGDDRSYLSDEELQRRDEADFEAGRWPYSPPED